MSSTARPSGQPPRAFDADAAARLIARFRETGADAQAFVESKDHRTLLDVIGGHSPYLADLAVREASVFMRALEKGPGPTLAELLAGLRDGDPTLPREQVAKCLRLAKRQGALILGAADLAGAWGLAEVTRGLSDLAEACIDLACAHLLLAGAARGDILLPSHGPGMRAGEICRGSGLVILGLGKLGGRELNYSSDVDLMVLYGTAPTGGQGTSGGHGYVRLARDLVRVLEERTADGYVFRTDLRLRPDPAATPLAVSTLAAIQYYESMGQNWERAALIKARPVAGDLGLGEQFLQEIRPFIWRRHLDFAAMADIHSIKRQIHAHKGGKGAGSTIALAGHDVKLGRGGIREIEFTVQVLQLIWGGRDPSLRDPTTLGALRLLATAGKMDPRAADDLAEAYVFHRTLEHRLQMVADRQTHRLPEDAAGLERIARFMGYRDTASFAAAFLGHLMRVERHYGRQFETGPALTAGGALGNLVFTGVEDDPDTLATLRRLGFQSPGSIAAMVRSWHSGKPRAMRSGRARELMTELVPNLLAAFACQSQPDQALARFDAMLNRISTGVQVLSLLHRNPGLLGRIAGILGAAPALADHLVHSAAALDGLLAGSATPTGTPPCEPLALLVKEARHFEEALEAARRLTFERKFEIDAAALEGLLDVDTAGLLRSELADTALAALLPRIIEDFAGRFGRVPGGQFGIVALGKLGGREMLPGSDLDLILLYDHDEEATGSNGGRRSLASSEYFIRLAHQVVAAITAPGTEGRLYDVDMRLRPSGNKGPVAIRLSAFEQYHRKSAWTWERMALTRARPVAGPPDLQERIVAVLRGVLTKAGSGDLVLADAAAMRQRMLRDLPPEGPWDVKAQCGGLVEVEFIAQALQLAHAEHAPALLATTTRLALANLAGAGLLEPDEVATLVRADRLWRAITGLVRLTLGKRADATLPEPVARALLRGVAPLLPEPAVDVPTLRTQMRRMADAVRESFERRVGPLGKMGD